MVTSLVFGRWPMAMEGISGFGRATGPVAVGSEPQ